jgi:hypothetical protein
LIKMFEIINVKILNSNTLIDMSHNTSKIMKYIDVVID